MYTCYRYHYDVVAREHIFDITIYKDVYLACPYPPHQIVLFVVKGPSCYSYNVHIPHHVFRTPPQVWIFISGNTF